jgi:hypothetical protein
MQSVASDASGVLTLPSFNPLIGPVFYTPSFYPLVIITILWLARFDLIHHFSSLTTTIIECR